MPSLLDELYKSILEYVSNTNRLLGPPDLKRSSRDNYSVCSGNFFPRIPDDLPLAINELTELVDRTVKKHIRADGELIKSIIREGEIWDGGKAYFKIKGGSHFEVYCFNCKSLTLVRIQHEKMLYPPQKEWLSIDIDEDSDTLWLAESRSRSAVYQE